MKWGIFWRSAAWVALTIAIGWAIVKGRPYIMRALDAWLGAAPVEKGVSHTGG